jgi:uncharacterized membrane protein YqjE
MDEQAQRQPPPPGEVGELMKRIGDGLKTIAEDEVKLAKIELLDELKKPLASAGAIVLGGVIAIVGIALLGTTVVVALEPIVPALWLRMAVMSVVYFLAGYGLMRAYAKKFLANATPELPRASREAKRTVEAVKAELSDGQ